MNTNHILILFLKFHYNYIVYFSPFLPTCSMYPNLPYFKFMPFSHSVLFYAYIYMNIKMNS